LVQASKERWARSCERLDTCYNGFIRRENVLVILLSLLACTENQRSRALGGTMEVKVPCDQSVFDVTWKGEDLWYATQQAREGWVPETKRFKEHSSYGMIEGEVVIVESRCQ
jgi:hypothetical protein